MSHSQAAYSQAAAAACLQQRQSVTYRLPMARFCEQDSVID